jgi:hypothetical protein
MFFYSAEWDHSSSESGSAEDFLTRYSGVSTVGANVTFYK